MGEVKTNHLISLEQIETGTELFENIKELINIVKTIKPESFRKIFDPIIEVDLSSKLRQKINNVVPYDDTDIRNILEGLKTFKANRSELQGYRKNNVSIKETDLDENLKSIIFAIKQGGYDDRELRTAIETLKQIKLSKSEARSVYRAKEDTIKFEDLDRELSSHFENFETLEGRLEEVEHNKVNKNDLEKEYRKKSETITKDDLDINLNQILEKIPKEFDETHILLDLEKLEKTKFNANEITAYLKKDEAYENLRNISDKITIKDLSEALVNKINEIPEGFNPIQEKKTSQQRFENIETSKLNKGDAEYLYRKRIDLISEKDLNDELLNKVNAIVKGYDDSKLKESINELESKKIDINYALNTFKKKDSKVELSELSSDILSKLQNTSSVSLETIKTQIYNLQQNKAEKTDLKQYREKSILITKNDLDSDVTQLYLDSKTNKEDIEKLSKEKADKTSLQQYRDKDTEINESDLSKDLQSKINNILSNENIVEVKNKVQYLEEENKKKIDKTETLTKTEINDLVSKYRKTETKITENDLEIGLKEKINKKSEGVTGDFVTKEDIKDFRKSSEKIVEKDLDTSLQEKLNKKNEIIDSSNFLTKDNIKDFRKSSEKITETDLNQDIIDKLNKKGDSSINPSEIIKTHNKLNDLNGDDNYLHITKVEKEKFLGYDVTIKELSETIKTLNETVTKCLKENTSLKEKIKVLEEKINKPSTDPEEKPSDGGHEKPAKPEGNVIWEYEFQQKASEAQNKIELFNQSDWGDRKKITAEDVYGPNYESDDYSGGKFKIFYLGPKGNHLPEPKEVPRQEIDKFKAPSNQGGYSFDPEGGEITFETSPTSLYEYKAVLYK